MNRTLIALVFTLSVALSSPARAAPSLAEKAQLAVEATLPAGLAVAQISLPPSLPAGDVAVSWSTAPRPGWVSVLVTVRPRGRDAVRGWGRVQLKPLRRVLVAARALHVGEALVASNLTIEERAAGAGEGFELESEMLAGGKVMRAVAAGQMLLEADVARPAPVARGTQVNVVVRRGQITVTVPATLERAARPGERSAARVASLGRVIEGRLADGVTLIEEGATP